MSVLSGWVLQRAVLILFLSMLFTTQAVQANADPVPSDPLDTEILAGPDPDYRANVRPLIESRCVVCHSCYDAPCQLKMEAWEGFQRGAIKEVVYDGARLNTMDPTRLFIDHNSEAAWRERGFHPVLPSIAAPDEPAILQRMLALKQQHPLVLDRQPLGSRFNLQADRNLHCPKPDEMARFETEHAEWGMPYGLPALKPHESSLLMSWLKKGAPPGSPEAMPPAVTQAVDQWEGWLNTPDNRKRLLARYLYEHLFAAHIYFSDVPAGLPRYFRLVRSSTPAGTVISEIPSVRPFDDPGVKDFYYRLRPIDETIVDKSHLIYAFNAARMQRYESLFISPDYHVDALPGYAPELAANPFITFAALPQRSRYRFLLDDAYFFFAGFMKGPVCHGQAAVNVIQDRFWVTFADPETDIVSNNDSFVRTQAEHLRLPSERENTPGVSDIAYRYGALQREYLAAKEALYQSRFGGTGPDLRQLWRGDGHNPDVLLTVFRHFDSASVRRGWLGDVPLTGWVLDYPLMERIHYLLVAGFDVFGNVRHQLATRFFMDYMRMEAEANFLAYLPASMRVTERAHWYQGIMGTLSTTVSHPLLGVQRQSGVHYDTAVDAKADFFRQVRNGLEPFSGTPDLFNCTDCVLSPLDLALRPLAHLKGARLEAWPELMFLRIRPGSLAGSRGAVYSLVRNTALRNVSIIFLEEARKLPEENDLTLVKGFVGSYPNFFLDVDPENIADFVSTLLSINDKLDFEKMVTRYGVRRSDSRFWEVSDWLNQRHHQDNSPEAGWFDLNRYEDH